jgi:hypothetical protein
MNALAVVVATITGERVGVGAFVSEFPDFAPLSLTDPFDPAAPSPPLFWLWPQQTGGNGMFVTAWRRTASAGCLVFSAKPC